MRSISSGGHPCIGSHLGQLFHDTGIEEVTVSTSPALYSDPEKRRSWAQIGISILSRPEYIKRVTEGGLTTVEEIEAIKAAYKTWQEIPGALMTVDYFEAIGRKA